MAFLAANWIIFGVLTAVSFAVAIGNFLRVWRKGNFPNGSSVAVHLICMFFVLFFGLCFSIGSVIQIVHYVNAHP